MTDETVTDVKKSSIWGKVKIGFYILVVVVTFIGNLDNADLSAAGMFNLLLGPSVNLVGWVLIVEGTSWVFRKIRNVAKI